ncbi:hypothetical protein PV08_11898 [Exophiala spinifera]|uniref:FAS1 domain-containing protein n=1 Tax=Exophiala spinifera TaxID=91928 RepID=A0A0D1Z9V6_9EURO|nr:uncharacterized protein PV08_11898 [Exophiala spinifera]KIW09797.1 hypothetical protein PV08_11898 [Exophiala spinifera]
MTITGLLLAALAGTAIAQSSDLVTVLNSTNGTATFSEVLAEIPGFLEAIAGKTNITVLAPNDTAIAELLASPAGQALEDGGADYALNLVLYHVIDGGYENITDYAVVPTLLTSSNYTNVTGGQHIGFYWDDDEDVVGFYGGNDFAPEASHTPIPFDQGWIYVLNGVLQIPPSMSETVTSGDFNGSSFVAALEKAGLKEEFDLLHDATYFVPVNDGFDAVEDALSKLSTEELAEVLKYHVVAGKVWDFELLEKVSQVTTLQGKNLTVTQTPDEEWFINQAGIHYTDLAVAGGVVLFIDNVLNPLAADFAAPRNGTDGEGLPAFTVTNATSTSGTNDSTSSTASASPSIASATSTGLAAMPLSVGISTLIGGIAVALLF